MADEPLAAELGRLPHLTAVQLGSTAAGDATLAALTFAHRAASWAKTYGECIERPHHRRFCFERGSCAVNARPFSRKQGTQQAFEAACAS